MKRLAVCCAEFAPQARAVIGGNAPIITAPPLSPESLDIFAFSGLQFLYVDLHGHPDRDYFSDNTGMPVMYAAQVATLDLRGCTVFATTCHLGNNSHPLRSALLRAGARAVIAGPGENYTTTRLSGAAELARYFQTAMRLRLSPANALTLSKRLYKRGKPNDKLTADTLAFTCFEVA